MKKKQYKLSSKKSASHSVTYYLTEEGLVDYIRKHDYIIGRSLEEDAGLIWDRDAWQWSRELSFKECVDLALKRGDYGDFTLEEARSANDPLENCLD
jgi:hypothetical protein